MQKTGQTGPVKPTSVYSCLQRETSQTSIQPTERIIERNRSREPGIYLLSVETLMLLSRCFAILTSRQVWIWAAKSEPSSSQNSSELLWLPCVAQLPYLLHSAASLWAMMPKLSRCNAFNPQRPCYALQRGVLTVLHHSWKSFSVIRAKL